MSSALMRGRILDKKAAQKAREWRQARIGYLEDVVKAGTATFKERIELIFKWGAKIEENKIIGEKNDTTRNQ